MAQIGTCFALGMVGLKGHLIKVEAHHTQGLPAFALVGLPDASLRESRSRVEAAIASTGLRWEPTRLTVNLSPAELPKTGSGFDLPIALAVVASRVATVQKQCEGMVFCGELGLDGRIYRVRGILPLVLAARRAGFKKVMVATEAVPEASLIEGIEIVGVSHLVEALHYLGMRKMKERVEQLKKLKNTVAPSSVPVMPASEPPDLQEVKGAFLARKALEIAAAGGHHLSLIGVPGAGKTMLASCLPGILPPLADEEALEVTSIHSLAGTFAPSQGLIRRPPFIAPHHSATLPALIGGGSGIATPGAISLAHRGVLFLDEAPEFQTRSLDALRQPLETSKITVHRSRAVTSYPAAFQLVIAANPCPCGMWGQAEGECKCTPYQRVRYLARLSGPLMDRIDLQCQVGRPKIADLTATDSPESSSAVRERVLQARERARKRWKDQLISLNARIPSRILKFALDSATKDRLNHLVGSGRISMRGADRICRVAWTIADLNGRDKPIGEDFGLAYSLRTSNGTY
ncbi:YifB family Mg chelatase-like AAA ATPase [uncultured Varibaculum sp.]|uniref:YifB family Mg chelatase-like AAA ATPase n=1 Tax=uncultured Varibaculum sp. TaxID=413896 RepID=UPI0026772FD7|nr:YifB family Mg chelatase-like AAA ATPase [uncultured Varibaculum sp.]